MGNCTGRGRGVFPARSVGFIVRGLSTDLAQPAAGLSALTLAGLVAAGCTVSAGAALADTPTSTTRAAASASDVPQGPAIDALRASVTKAVHARAAARASAADASNGSAATPSQSATPSWTRLAGADRYATAVAIAKQAYPTGASTVFIATGTSFPDALTAGPVAVAKDAPLLLTLRDAIPSSTLAELQALHPSSIVVVGGTNAVSANVVTKLGKLAGVSRVTRIGGKDRSETSRLLAEYGFGATGADSVFLATGANYPDALSVSSVAGLAAAPILLVNGAAQSLDRATTTELKKLGVEGTFLVGGTRVVSRGVEKSIPTAYLRLAGDDRFETNALIANVFFSKDMWEGVGFMPSSLSVATGANFPDALVGGVLAASEDAAGPVLLVKKSAWPVDTLAFVKGYDFDHAYLLGGTNVLSDQLTKLNTTF